MTVKRNPRVRSISGVSLEGVQDRFRPASVRMRQFIHSAATVFRAIARAAQVVAPYRLPVVSKVRSPRLG